MPNKTTVTQHTKVALRFIFVSSFTGAKLLIVTTAVLSDSTDDDVRDSLPDCCDPRGRDETEDGPRILHEDTRIIPRPSAYCKAKSRSFGKTGCGRHSVGDLRPAGVAPGRAPPRPPGVSIPPVDVSSKDSDGLAQEPPSRAGVLHAPSGPRGQGGTRLGVSGSLGISGASKASTDRLTNRTPPGRQRLTATVCRPHPAKRPAEEEKAHAIQET